MVQATLGWDARLMNPMQPSLLDLAPATGAFYIDSSIPAGLTIGEYRRSRARRARRQRLRDLGGFVAGAVAVRPDRRD
jgi:hypothetical protein